MNMDQVFDSVLRHSKGYSMSSLWQSLGVEVSSERIGCQEQVEIFLSLLGGLLQKGEIRLALKGEFLEGDVDQLLQTLRAAWPNSKDELEADMGLWFLVGAPAGIVWFTPDGQEIWT